MEPVWTARSSCFPAGRIRRSVSPGRCERFARVETIGFDYRPAPCRRARRAAARSATALAADCAAMARAARRRSRGAHRCARRNLRDGADPRHGDRNVGSRACRRPSCPAAILSSFRFAGALAYRRGIKPSRRRHVRDRLFRLSGLPRRHHQGDAGCADARHGPALRHPYAADVDRQGRRRSRWPHEIGGAAADRSRFSPKPTPAISATARTGTPGVLAAANVRPAGCAREGYARWKAAS